MGRLARLHLLATLLAAVVAAPALAGPPLIHHPFHTAGGALLPWGSGPGWNVPDRRYDVAGLTEDMLRLLSPELPVLTRMENIRRAVIYASRDVRSARRLLTALTARAEVERPAALALFDAGYLIETFKQAEHLYAERVTDADGYALVVRAMRLAGSPPPMEFAAALMTKGPTADAHLVRARAAADATLAKNISDRWP